ncbi:MFS transporter [Roseomonas elaeocarpi]|uniref:MFS transporter n=1 Tax=Roseomonas elaeocarpi TaxID=907779 RepID=A0ABV6JYB9_9PROT
MASATALRGEAVGRGRYKWSLVLMLWLVSFLNYADRNAITAVMPQLRQDFALDNVQLGLLSSAFLWVYAIAASFAGYLGDRFSRRLVILGGLVVWSLVTFVTPLAGGFGAFIVLRALTGLGEASYYPSGTALISDYHGPDTRSRALAIHQTAVFAGGGLGTLGAAWLAERYDWHAAYYTYGALGFVLAAVLWFTMRESPRAAQREAAAQGGASYRIVLTQPAALMLYGVFFCATFVSTGVTVWAPTFFRDVLQFSLTQASFYGALTINLAGFVAVLCSGAVADWAIRRTRMARFYVLAGGLFLAAICLAPFGFLATALPLAICLLLAGFFKGIFDGSIYAAMHDIVPPEARATAVGLMTTLGFIGAGIAPVAIGWLSESIGLGLALSLTAALYVVAVLLLLVSRGLVTRAMDAVARDAASH